MLVKNADWPENANIIASVHVGSELDTHIDLNDRMVEQLLNLSKRLGASPYLVNAYPVTPANITIELPEFDPTTYTDAVRGHHLTAMKALRQKHGLSEEQTLVQQGLPEDVIPEAAKQLNAAMVILGTTGRTGLSAVFIGNTAEHVIDKINCDVLALKPNGYVSPSIHRQPFSSPQQSLPYGRDFLSLHTIDLASLLFIRIIRTSFCSEI